MRARLVHEVGTRAVFRIYWDAVTVDGIDPCDQCLEGHPSRVYARACPNCYGKGKPGIHNAELPLGTSEKLDDRDSFGKPEDYPADRWPTKCDHCSAPVPVEARMPVAVGENGISLTRQVFRSKLYDTASGRPEPGDVYRVRMHESNVECWWTNCDGVHLIGVLPNGHEWGMCNRASNCTMQTDRTHRCWVLTGTPEDGTLTASKTGAPTCAAGGGSIMAGGWHGFLRNMTWESC